MAGINSHRRIERRAFLSAIGAGTIVGTAGCTDGLDQVGGGGGEGFVTIATGGTGGVYYILGGGIADLLNEDEELDVDASAEATGASVENAQLIGAEDVEMALILGNSALLAVEGEGDFDEPVPLQAAFGAYQNHTQVVVPEDSEIETLADMEGASVSVGAPGSGTEVIAAELLEWYGLTYDDISEERLAFDETADALIDGQLDAGFWSVGPPASSIEEVYSQREVRLLSFPEEDLAEIDEEFPYYEQTTLEAGTYPDQDEDVLNPGVTNVMAVNENMDEEFLYDIMAVVFENIEALENVHGSAGDFEESARDAPIDYHPGGESYLDDAGL